MFFHMLYAGSLESLISLFIHNSISNIITSFTTQSQVYVINCREGTFFLVIDHFSDEVSHIMSELQSRPRSLFLFLKTAIEIHISGTLNFCNLRKDNKENVTDKSKGIEAYLEKISEFPKFLRNNPFHVTDDMIERYLEVSNCTSFFERNTGIDYMGVFSSFAFTLLK